MAAIAKRDLRSAELLVREAPPNSVFHSQQAAEKTAKALLAADGVSVPKIHDLKQLGDKCIELRPELTGVFEQTASLSDYAVVFRYLEAPYEPDAVEAADALARATALYDAVKAELGL